MAYFPPISPYAAGLGGKCPRCGQGDLYGGFLKLRDCCDACGLDYAQADSGDGPAVFAIFIVGIVAVAVAFIARFVFYAPMAVAFLISAGLAAGMTLMLLRPLKATLIAVQYQNRAAEGRLEE